MGYELPAELPPSDLRAAETLLREALRPAEEALIKQELARLRVSTKSRAENDDDLAMGFQVVGEECAKYPPDVMVSALRGWANRETFYPSLAEIRDGLQRAARKRKAMLDAVRRAQRGEAREETP